MNDDTPVAYHQVAKTSELDEDEVMQVNVNGKEIALYNLGGTFYATGDTCTHAFASLADGYIEGDRIECPLHGACFDIRTGEVKTPPASANLDTYPVKVEGDTIYVGIGPDGD